MSHALGLYRRLITANLRSQISYRASFWLESLASFVAAVTTFLTLALILQRFNNIAGWTLWEMAFLYGMVDGAQVTRASANRVTHPRDGHPERSEGSQSWQM